MPTHLKMSSLKNQTEPIMEMRKQAKKIPIMLVKFHHFILQIDFACYGWEFLSLCSRKEIVKTPT